MPAAGKNVKVFEIIKEVRPPVYLPKVNVVHLREVRRSGLRYMPIEKSAGAVIFRKQAGKILYLLLHYEARHWDLPKGHIEKGEKPEEAAKRETKEETGIKNIEFIPGFRETIKYFYKREGKNFFKIVIFFLAQTKTKKVKISLEHKGFKWLPYRKALEQLTFNNAKKVLQKANQCAEP